MAPPIWTTPEQYEWLSAQRSKFVEHQKSKKVADFWLELDRDWFTRWPEPSVAEAEREPPGHPSHDMATEALRSRKSVSHRSCPWGSEINFGCSRNLKIGSTIEASIDVESLSKLNLSSRTNALSKP